MTSKTKALRSEEFSAEDIQAGFNRLALYYDRFNDWISFGLHRLWKRKLVRLSGLDSGQAAFALDLCCGSGDIALLLARHLGPSGEVTAIDFSAEMLTVFKKRLVEYKKPLGTVKIYQQNVCSLENFSSDSFAAATMGFGLRNLRDRPAALKEIFRVLQPGGRLLILDVGRVKQPLLHGLHRFYFERVVPRIGYWLHGQKYKMYAYLPASARSYPAPEKICREVEQAGFTSVSYKNLLFGAAVIHIAHKTVSSY